MGDEPRALASLPKKAQQVLDLQVRQGKDDAETARALRIHQDEVRRLRKASGDWLASPKALAGVHADDGGDWPRTKRLLPWTIAAFVVMLWLIPFDSFELPFSLPLDATPDRPLLVAMGLLWLVSLTGASGTVRPSFRATPVHLAALLLFATALASVLLNLETLARVGEIELGLKKIMLLASYVLFFFIVASTVRPKEARAFMGLVVGLACITAIGAIVEYRAGFNAFFTWSDSLLPGSVTLPPVAFEDDSAGRSVVFGPAAHPLALSTLLALAVPFAVVRIIDSRERRERVFWAIATAIVLCGVFATQRKTGTVAGAAGLIVLVAYRPRQMLALAPVGAALIVAITIAAPGAIGGIRDQLKPTQLFGVLSTRDRESDYDAVTPEVVNNPLVGRGYQTYEPDKYRVLDNEYLAIVIGNGVLGLFAYMLVVLSTLWVCHRTIRSSELMRASPSLAVAAGAAIMAVSSALFDVIAFPHVPYMFFFLAGLAVACAKPRPSFATARIRAAARKTEAWTSASSA